MNRAALGTLLIGIGLVAGAVMTETSVFGKAGVPIALFVLGGGMMTAGIGIYRSGE